MRIPPKVATSSDTITPVVNDGFWKWRIVAIDPNQTVGYDFTVPYTRHSSSNIINGRRTLEASFKKI